MEGTTVDYGNINFNLSETDNNTSSRVLSTNTQDLERVLIALLTYVSPVLVCMCLLGNSLTMIILSRKRNRITSTSVLLTILAISDIVIVLTGIFNNWLVYVWNVDIRATGEIMCKVHVFMTYFSIHLSSGILVLVTFERTLCVISPHKVKLFFKRRNSLLCVACLGVALSLINGHLFYGANILKKNADGEMQFVCIPGGSPEYQYFLRNAWPWIDLCLSFLIPCVLILTGNILILAYLARRARHCQDLGVVQQKKPSLTLLLHLLTIVFLVSMAPYTIFTILLNYLVDNAEDPYEEFSRLINYNRILLILVAFNPTLNFILYFLSGSKFRDEVKALVSCKTTQSGSVF